MIKTESVTTSPFRKGQILDRIKIRKLLGGGELVSYLPRLNGKIIAGCFNKKLNRRAPLEIDVAKSADVVARAKVLAGVNGTIPVFLKIRPNEWEFVGFYQCTRFSQSQKDTKAYADRRTNAVGVLYLREVTTEHAELLPDFELLENRAVEGKKRLVSHFIRERRADLVIAKRNEIRADKGCLVCEACGCTDKDFPGSIGEACFEVHHKAPLSKVVKERETRLADLAMLCANCHRMIHRSEPMLTAKALHKLLLVAHGDVSVVSRPSSRR